jgi:hypothetical protein
MIYLMYTAQSDLELEVVEGQGDYWGKEIDEAENFDVIKSVGHNISAEVTANTLENGTKVCDHVVLQPNEITVIWEQTNTNGGADRAREVYQNLEFHYLQRDLFRLLTEHASYDNMVIKSLSGLEQGPNKGALQCAITLVQINFVTLNFVAVPESRVDTDVPDAATEINSGIQLPATIEPTLESDIPSMIEMLGLTQTVGL